MDVNQFKLQTMRGWCSKIQRHFADVICERPLNGGGGRGCAGPPTL